MPHGILYYDCTNYYFEIEQEDGLKQYGVSKEHRPNPIVQMGFFMDGDGLPLAFCINKYTCSEIISGLREMNFYEIKGDGYIPTYTRADFTDALHDAFAFRTDYQIVTDKQMKNFLKDTKKQKTLLTF